MHIKISVAERSSSVGIVTRLRVRQLRSRGSIPGSGERFFAFIRRPDRFWGVRNLLSNGQQGSHEMAASAKYSQVIILVTSKVIAKVDSVS
jgi:hypothetical protein